MVEKGRLMLKIAVLDDQELYLNKIEMITKNTLSGQGINYQLFKYSSAEALIYDLEENHKCDIYLLDIELPILSGLEVARKIREKYYDSVIIYITNYIEYAVEGYETNAYRYIPKKILEEKLPEAYFAVYEMLENKKKSFYIIENNHKIERIAYEDIFYVKKEQKYILFVHKHGISRERKTIAEFMAEARVVDAFVAVDRSYVINALHIMSLKNQQIHLRNGEQIPVSKPKLSYVKQEIMRIWRN